jgi:hypothetical protein
MRGIARSADSIMTGGPVALSGRVRRALGDQLLDHSVDAGAGIEAGLAALD